MKRPVIIGLFILLCVSVQAQFSQHFTHEDYYYSEGMRLYHEGHYQAAQSALVKYEGENYREQAAFYIAAAQFETRQKIASTTLKNFLHDYASTIFRSEVQFMLGTLEIENGKWKRGLSAYDAVNIKELFRPHVYEYYFRKGYALLQQGEPTKASKQFENLRKEKNPYTLQAKYYYAYCQYQLQNYGKALPEFLAIEHTEAYKKIVPYYIIQIYYSQGQYDEVYARAEYLFSNAPENQNTKELHRLMGEIYYREGEYNKAVQHLTAYRDKVKQSSETILREDCYLLGMSYYQLADYQSAAENLAKVEKRDDAITGNTLYHLGNAYQHIGKIDQAKLAYEAALRYTQTPELREQTLYNYALTTYQSSTALGEGINAFMQFLTEYPQSAHQQEIYQLMTDAFLRSKNYAAALEATEKMPVQTNEIKQTQQYLRYQLGTDAYLQGKYNEAKEWFTAVIDNHTKGSKDNYGTESLYWRAECNYRLKDYAATEADLQKYAATAPKTSENYKQVYYGLGYATFSQKAYADALKHFQQYIKTADAKTPTYIDALNRIGDCYYSQKNFSKAEGAYAKVIATGATGIDYATFQRGYCLGLLKRYGDKISILQGLVRKFPKSDYADDALYEIARAELQRDGHENDAIAAYNQLLSAYPNSVHARKAALEKGMTYYNLEQYEKAITAYKATIKNYPGSEEAYSALDGLQQTYIQLNRVDDFLAYVKTLGKANMKISSQEDSLTYMAAERQYGLQNYQEAAAGMAKYISAYCPSGRYCTMAQYYLADSHYRLRQFQNALNEFITLAEIPNNPYMSEAITRVAEIAYDLTEYQTAMTYFQKMLDRAVSTSEINTARLGVLRCATILKDYDRAIQISTEITNDIVSEQAVIAEAQYNRAKAYLEKSQPHLALNDLKDLSKEIRTAKGAECKYLLAESYFNLEDDDLAEQTIMEMASQPTSQQYWLAKSFILLSDIYVRKGDLFQAKQYLLSLKVNYPIKDNTDDIQATLEQRLLKIEDRENEQID